MTGFRGPRVAVVLSLALAALAGLQLAVWGSGEEGIRVLVRSSARSSVLLFSLAFTASSARVLWQNGVTKWLLANRRYLGLSYAASHAIHLLALIALYPASDDFRTSLNAVTLVGGGIAYAFTAAMAATSNDASVAALGRRRWTLLHTVGGWFIWFVFAQSYLPRAFLYPAYLPAAGVVLAVPALRGARRMRRRATQAQAA